MMLEIHLQMEAVDGLTCGNLNFPATNLTLLSCICHQLLCLHICLVIWLADMTSCNLQLLNGVVPDVGLLYPAK